MEDNERREITPLDFLEAVYLNPNLPLPTRMRAAIEAAPYKHSKLSTTTNVNIDGTKSFADALDRAIARSRSPPQLNGPVIEHAPLISVDTLKKPFATFRRF